MGNQQVNPDYEIGWLVGILDGEGWFILGKATNHPSKKIRYVPTVGVNSTDESIVKELSRILDKYQIGYWIKKREFKKKIWKDQWILVIRGFKRVKKILPLVKDKLICKSKPANLIFSFIKYRESLDYNEAYSKEEEKFYLEAKRLNQKGKTPTTKG